jgi:hypothetical protein
VGGKPAGHGSGRIQRGRRADKSWRQLGQTPHQGDPQPWQLAPSNKSPAAATQTWSPEGEKLTARFWGPDPGQARTTAESVDSGAYIRKGDDPLEPPKSVVGLSPDRRSCQHR